MQGTLDLQARMDAMEAELREARERAAAAEKRAADLEAAAAADVKPQRQPGIIRIPTAELRAGLSAAVAVFTTGGRRFDMERNLKGFWDFTADRRFFKAGGKTIPTKGISGRLAQVLGVFLWALENPETVGELHDLTTAIEAEFQAAATAATAPAATA